MSGTLITFSGLPPATLPLSPANLLAVQQGAKVNYASVADVVGTYTDPNVYGTAINVLNAGLVGDGVTNNTAAFAAITAANRAYIFPAGVYVIDTWVPAANNAVLGAGQGVTVLLRAPGSTQNFLINNNVAGLTLANLTVDGNAANGVACINLSNGPGYSQFTALNVESRYAVFASPQNLGQGCFCFGSLDQANKTRSKFINCNFNHNAGDGLSILDSTQFEILGGDYSNNASNGIEISNFILPQTPDNTGHFSITGAHVCNNAGVGIALGPLPVPLNATSNRYTSPGQKGSVTGCYVESNANYGIACSAVGIAIIGNSVLTNSISTNLGGILLTGAYCTCSGNIIAYNTGFAIDAGASAYCSIDTNTIFQNGLCGINLGGCIGSVARNNTLTDNGISAIQFNGVDSPGGTFPLFPTPGANCLITDNILAFSTGAGISLKDGPTGAIVLNNVFARATNDQVCITGNYVGANISGNRHTTIMGFATIASASTVVVPDWCDNVYISGTTTVNNIMVASQTLWAGTLAFATVTNTGSNYPVSALLGVLVTGGSPSTPATVIASTDGTGGVQIAQCTSYGAGYVTTTPTLTVANTGTFVAGITGNAMTISSVLSGIPQYGATVTGGGVVAGTTIQVIPGGFGAGTYLLNNSSNAVAGGTTLVATMPGSGAVLVPQLSIAGATDNRTFKIRLDSGITLANAAGNLRMKGGTNFTTSGSGATYINLTGISGVLEQN